MAIKDEIIATKVPKTKGFEENNCIVQSIIV